MSASLTLQLASPGTRYEPRSNQIDFGVRRTIRLHRATVQAQIDLFNALNANPILSEGTALSSTVGPFLSSDPRAGGTPFTILQPRLIRLGAQITF